MNYFSISKDILDKILKTFKDSNIEYGLIVGGGYGYESTKYTNSDKLGDIDCLLFLKNIDDINKVLSDQFFASIGFDLNKSDKIYSEDIKLYNDKLISLIRYSGYIKEVKTGFKILTFDRLKELYLNKSIKPSYIVSHGSNNCIFMAKGVNGNDLILTSMSLDVSNLYQDERKHYIWPYYSWYSDSENLYIGAWTDFIAKGLILKDDNSKTIENIQTKILKQIAESSPPEILKNKKWDLLFANNHYFSENFSSSLNSKIDTIVKGHKIQGSKITVSRFSNDLLVTSFFKSGLYNEELSTDYELTASNTENIVSLESILTNNSIDLKNFENSLHILNAEAKRLNDLLTLGMKYEEFTINEVRSIYDLNYIIESDYMFVEQSRANQNILGSIIKNTMEDIKLLETLKNEAKILLEYIIQLRINVINFLLKYRKLDIQSFKFVDSHFLELCEEQENLNVTFNNGN